MANAAVQLFSAFMEEKELSVHVLEDDENSCRIGFELNNTHVQIFVDFSEDGTDAHFTGVDFLKIPQDKVEMIYKVCNDCNNQYRWVKFVWDEKYNNIVCNADAELQLDSCAEECFEIVMRMAGIIDKAYPTFMKAMWA